MPVFNFNKNSRQSVDLDSADFIDYLTGGNNTEYVTADQALQNSDLYSLISQLSADLALVVFRTPSQRMQTFLANPSNDTNGFSFWQGMFAQLLLDGNAYAYRWQNNNGVDLYWEGLRPSQVNVYKDLDGTGLLYDVDFDEPNIGAISNIPQGEMIHFRLMSKNSIGIKGYSPLRALTDELAIKNKSNDLTKNALGQSVMAPGILTIQGAGLLDENKKAARSRAFVRQQKNSANGPIVLDDLETYQPLEIKSDVAKLLAQVDWTSKQVAKVYGVPDSYLNGAGDQQSNLDQENGQYAKALKRFVGPIASELNNKLNTTVTPDLRPSVDAIGDGFANKISSMVKDSTISANQAQFILKRLGYLPQDLPEYQPQKGSDNNENNSNEG
ncbi:phage portal protein [Lactobacillus acetotolerans]|jgi:HK97 family phage portal protein|uniref:phage portal protein n=1 Tax=Lactobacillus acetotolerans TaxID=1600 RepID=UPI00247FDCFC|nr:phage portal protein [Lactobacillus acetotolerans]